MKKYLVLLVFLCVPFCFVGCDAQAQRLNTYNIDVVFDEQENILSCSQQVDFVNHSDNAISSVCFFLYANAFNEDQKAVPSAYFFRAYPNGESYGNISFSKILVKKNEANYEISENKNILTIQLNQSLFPEESVKISMDYVVNLANINHRLGYGDNAINFGNFFPIACVYEDNQFVKNDFSVNGDPFYSEVANFSVTITCSNDFVVAASGNKHEEVIENQKKVYCQAEKVRDFCFVLSKKFELLSENVGEVCVNYYFYDDLDAKHHLQTSADALKTFQSLFGEYPFKQLSVVKTNFCFGGMEYPNLVMISDDLADSETVDYVIVHEIAHQWWYSLVGNNEFSEAWIDEGLTEYSTFLFYEKNISYGQNYDDMIKNATSSYVNFVDIYTDILGEVDQSMNRKLTEFSTEPEYVHCVYTKGVLMYDSLRSLLKDKKFFRCLKNYFETFKYQNVSQKKFVENFSKSSNQNLKTFFNSWLDGKVKIKNS